VESGGFFVLVLPRRVNTFFYRACIHTGVLCCFVFGPRPFLLSKTKWDTRCSKQVRARVYDDPPTHVVFCLRPFTSALSFVLSSLALGSGSILFFSRPFADGGWGFIYHQHPQPQHREAPFCIVIRGQGSSYESHGAY